MVEKEDTSGNDWDARPYDADEVEEAGVNWLMGHQKSAAPAFIYRERKTTCRRDSTRHA